MRHPMEVGVEILKLFLDMEISLDAVVPRKDAVLALAADRLAARAGMSYEHSRDALAGREKLGSTGLGRGVAMPHAISPHCMEPAAALVRLTSPVDFDAPDGMNVDVVFALIWPRSRPQEFIKFSAAISNVLSDPVLVQLARRSADPDLIRRSMYLRAQADSGCAGASALRGHVADYQGWPPYRAAVRAGGQAG